MKCTEPSRPVGRRGRLWLAMLMAVQVGGLLHSQQARADEFTDLLDLLKAKGTLSASEYRTLLDKHRQHLAMNAPSPAAGGAMPAGTAAGSATAAAMPAGTEAPAAGTTAGSAQILAQAQQAAAQAQVSAQVAAAASAKLEAVDTRRLVRADPYTPGKGIGLTAGDFNFNISGFVNGFYTYNRPGGGQAVAGGVSTGPSRFDSSSVRNGLLPAGLVLKMSTTQAGIDINTVFGIYPGLNSADPGAFNANSGGSPVGLGTAGVDFRQAYITAGTSSFGTVKVGRDLGLFGSDAILDDATLLSVGATGSNSAPGNTSLGRIGVGYVYADWLPQISYASPVMHGVQLSMGVMTPLDAYNYAGAGLSATSTSHSGPMMQGKLTWDFGKADGFNGRIWSGFLFQRDSHLTSSVIPADSSVHANASAGELGTKLNYGPWQTVLYYYRGNGLGTTGLFFDGLAQDGRRRTSQGYYAQLSYQFTHRLKAVASYGASQLYSVPGEDVPLLVRRNLSEIGAIYYSLTRGLSLVGEYTHTSSTAQGPHRGTDDSISGGAIFVF